MPPSMCFSLSAGHDFITSEQLRRQIRNVDAEPSQFKTKTKRHVSNGTAVEEESRAHNYAAGDSDVNNDDDCDYSADMSGMS